MRQPETGSQLTVELSSAAVSTVDPCSIQELKLCTSASRLTAMALLTVGLVTGYFPDKKSLREISHPRAYMFSNICEKPGLRSYYHNWVFAPY